MKEEMKKILKMVEEKKITAEDGERLMEALEPEGAGVQTGSGRAVSPKFLKVKVVEEGKTKVNVNIPISLVEVGLKIATKLGPQYKPELEVLKDIDFNEIAEAIKQGAQGKLVDIQDGDTSVEVYAE